jgi:gliding motility-associated-like protein
MRNPVADLPVKKITAIAFLSLLLTPLFSQQDSSTAYCVAEELREELLKVMPGLAEKENEMERWYRIAAQTASKGTASTLYTLPVVVHIVHQNGPENIPDMLVLQGIADLNDAFRKQNSYYNEVGVDVELEFCLAERDPVNNPTTGIARHLSPLTDMAAYPGASNLFNQFGWNTRDYINIFLVKDACIAGNCDIGGFAVYPYGHGHPVDGIVIQADYFGVDPATSTIAAHEMGHYLGLLHTFHGGCPNGDCLSDGDKVCDTPPDNTTGNYPCSDSYNSCQTDEDDPSANNPYRSTGLGGLGDQPDMYSNFMDYSFLGCTNQFTQGQKDRMLFFLENVRASLLDSKACLPPCPNEVTALFDFATDSVAIGGSIAVTNLSSNAGGFVWYDNGQQISTAASPVLTFNTEGVHTITLEALSPSPLCYGAVFEQAISVYCPVLADFQYHVDGDWLYLQNQSIDATEYTWTVKDGDGTPLFNSTQASDSMNIAGLAYIQVCLQAGNGLCSEQTCQYVQLAPNGVETCNNSLDDDMDGYVDLFDPDCPCDFSAYQAYCQADCELVPDSFPSIQMKLKWKSEIISIHRYSAPNIVCGDINNDGTIEVLSNTYYYTNIYIDSSKIKILKGADGNTVTDFETQRYNDGFLAISNMDAVGGSEIYALAFDTIKAFSNNGVLLWKSDKLEDNDAIAVNIADFNSDGIPELYAGNEIFNSTNGKKLANGTAGAGCTWYLTNLNPCNLKHTIAADLLPSPGLELAAGNTVYQVSINNLNGLAGNTMTAVLAPSEVKDGFTSIGDINGDGELDVVVVKDKAFPGGGGIWVWDPRTLNVIASASSSFRGGVAFVGDVTGDCLPEIGVTFQYELRMYQYNGTPQLQLLYSLPTTDDSGFTGITMFDFNQDGKQELVYRDETDLRILEGETGATLASYPLKSGTGTEYPVVADVDNDGQAEILVNGYEDENNIEVRVYCFESASAPWAPARSVWNQYSYHVTNVNDDLTIPRQEQNMAQPLGGYQGCLQPTCPAPYNAFLAQATYRTQQGCVQWPADGDISITSTMRCTGDNVEVCVYVENVDTLLFPDGFPGWCGTFPEHLYFPNAVTILDTFYIKDSFCFLLPAMLLKDTIFVAVNDPAWPFPYGGNPSYTECDYSNNTKLLIFPIEPKTLDLGPDIVKCASEVTTLNAGAGFETYLWNDATTDSIYSSGFPGLHFVEATDQCGKVYRDTVLFTIDPTDEVSLGPDVLICPGDTLSYGLTGSYDLVQWFPAGSVNCDTCMQVAVTSDTAFLLTVVVGKGSCFSADTVAVEVAQRVDVLLDTSICEGEALPFMGSTLASAGQYEFNLNGCDSFLTVNLTLLGSDTTFLQTTICTGDSVLFGGTWLKSAGTYAETLTNSLGCDSMLLLDLAVVNTIETSDTLSICDGDSVSVFGQWVFGETLLEETFTSAAGCDSTQYFQVLVTPMPHQQVSYNICQGDSVLVGSTWLIGAGQHSVTVFSLTDCDTIYEVEISEIPPISNTDTLTICEGDSVSVFGQWVFGEILLGETFTSAAGCDSTQYYQVLVNPLPHQQASYSVCEGDSVFIGGGWLSGSGLHTVMLASQTGCDTVLEVSLSEILPVSHTDTLTICEGDSVFIFGQWLHGGGSASGTFTSAAGCDSTQYFQVVELAMAIEQLGYELCQGDSVLVGGEWLTGAGNYSVLASSGTGCDTLYEVSIIELPNISNIDTVKICEGDSALIFGAYISSPGTYSDIFSADNGCDSTQVYIVEILSYQYVYDTLSTCEGDSLYIAGQWVFTGGLHTDTIANMPCNTISYIWAEFKHIVQTDATVSLCPGDSILIENNWVKNTGQYSAAYTGSNGCDSINNISVVVLEAPNAPYAEVDCENLEVLVGIEAQAGWQVLWDNGATTFETVYQNSDTARVAMSAQPDCEADFTIALPQLPDPADLPEQENLSFAPGQSIAFGLQLDPSEWKVVWSPSSIFTCDTCLSTVARPTESTTIEATYTHASGCIYQNSFLVFMEKEPGIYVPNAFSPNGDGTNDRWEVLPPEGVAQFDEVLVFGRWGSLVAQWHSIAQVGWDGSFRGRPLDPDVFVYYIRYTDGQGRKVEVKGDVALLR